MIVKAGSLPGPPRPLPSRSDDAPAIQGSLALRHGDRVWTVVLKPAPVCDLGLLFGCDSYTTKRMVLRALSTGFSPLKWEWGYGVKFTLWDCWQNQMKCVRASGRHQSVDFLSPSLLPLPPLPFLFFLPA